jgi:hypothetical protein
LRGYAATGLGAFLPTALHSPPAVVLLRRRCTLARQPARPT